MQIDTQWFVDRLADKKLSQRRLAKLLGMDPATLNLLLHGKRRMNISRATEIARFLGVPVATVIRKAGVVVDEHTGHRSLPLVGWIDGDSIAHLDFAATEDRFNVNAELPADAVAVQWRTTQTVGDAYDGWTAITVHPREPDEAEMLNRFCLVGTKDGRVHVREIRRGYTKGRNTLVVWSREPIHDAEIAWFAPILLIIPK